MGRAFGIPVLLLAAAAALVLAPGAPAAGGAAGAAAGGGDVVHLRGTAYEFNNTRVVLAGATIRVAELPRVRTTVRRDGTYELAVPDRARVTPYIVAPGYHTIHLQTFTTASEDLDGVNFQTPTDNVYRALAALLDVRLDAAGQLRNCAIVSTFLTRNVRGLSFQAFRRYGAHGVAGATATTSPGLPAPTYFNEDVLPDRAQAVSSKDGGVIWTEVPAGVYTVRGRQPDARFASFVATCRPGRVVNANPEWGLYELGLPNPARVSSRWTVDGPDATLDALRAGALPRGAVLRVRCTGRRCPFTVRTMRPEAATLDVRRALGARAARLGAGQTLELSVSARGHDGAVWRWPIVAGRAPRASTLCVPLGFTKPRRRCG